MWRQFAGTLRPDRTPQIPIRKCLWSRNSDLGSCDHTGNCRQIRQGINFLTAPNAQHHPTDQEQRQIRSNLSRNPQSFSPRQLFLQSSLKRQKRSYSIPRRPAQSALHRQPLLNFDNDAPTRLQRRQSKLDNPVASVRLIPRHPQIFTMNLNPRSPPNRNPNDIVPSNRLINRPQLMKPIPPKRTDPQTEINLGERSNGYRHGGMILTKKLSVPLW